MAVMMWLPSRAHAIRRTPNRTLTALSNRPDHGLWCARRWRGSADDGESAGPERGRGCGAGGILEPERALPPERSRQHAGPPGRPRQHAGPPGRPQATRRTHQDGPGNTPDPPRAAQATRRTHLTDSGRAVAYLWSLVLNGCRSALRYRAHRPGVEIGEPIAPSAASTPRSTRNTRPYRRATSTCPTARGADAAVFRRPQRGRDRRGDGDQPGSVKLASHSLGQAQYCAVPLCPPALSLDRNELAVACKPGVRTNSLSKQFTLNIPDLQCAHSISRIGNPASSTKAYSFLWDNDPDPQVQLAEQQQRYVVLQQVRYHHSPADRLPAMRLLMVR